MNSSLYFLIISRTSNVQPDKQLKILIVEPLFVSILVIVLHWNGTIDQNHCGLSTRQKHYSQVSGILQISMDGSYISKKIRHGRNQHRRNQYLTFSA